MSTSVDVQAALKPLLEFQGWKYDEGDRKVISKAYEFKDFKQAMRFMNQVADVAEKMQHHPEWWNVYNKLQVTLTTHDAGNTVTQKDVDLASAMDSIATELRTASSWS